MEMIKYDGSQRYAHNWDSLEDILKATPGTYYWEGVGGSTEDGISAVAVLKDGNKKALDESNEYENANGAKTVEDPIPTIGEQISGLDVVGLEIKAVSIHTWNDTEDFEGEFYIPLQPLDVKRIRRRVEDALRKTTDATTVCNLALKLGCKLTD